MRSRGLARRPPWQLLARRAATPRNHKQPLPSTHRSLVGVLDAAVRVPREAALLAGMHRAIAGPRPAAELRALVVAHRLLGSRRACSSRTGRTARRARRSVALAGAGAPRRRACLEFDVRPGSQHDARVRVERCARRPSIAGAAKEVQRTVRPAALRAAACSARAAPCVIVQIATSVSPRASPRLGRRRPARARRRVSRPAIVISVAAAVGVAGCVRRNVVAPQHREVRLGDLVGGREVEPDLEQLHRVRARALDAAGTSRRARCRGPRSATARRRGRSARSRRANRSDRCSPRRTIVTVSKPRCGCCGNPGTIVAVVHAPAVLAREVLADLAAGERRGRSHALVARRIGDRRGARRTGTGRRSPTESPVA